MQLFFYSVIAFLLLGALGMAIANRKVPAAVSRQRWLKYLSYVIITSIVFTAILLNIFYVAAFIIIAFGWYELRPLLFSKKTSVIVFLIYSLVSMGLIGFAFTYALYFQLFIYLQVLLFDAFSQITGQLLGKHSMVPAISPTKTIEGAIGGLLFSIFSALLLSNWQHLSIRAAMFLGVLTALSSLGGDLLASYAKRKARIKDFSNLLPYQGGFLDRFDSLLMTGTFYFIISLN